VRTPFGLLLVSIRVKDGCAPLALCCHGGGNDLAQRVHVQNLMAVLAHQRSAMRQQIVVLLGKLCERQPSGVQCMA
jgi:hypothetical protein